MSERCLLLTWGVLFSAESLECLILKLLLTGSKQKLATWKGTSLSIMGRVQLVKSIIHGMLVYSFHVYMWPRRLVRSLNTWIKNFIWSGDVFTRKVCTVPWNIVCRPWLEGGLDIKSTRLINDAFMLKLAWNLFSTNSQWATLFKSRFFSQGQPIRHFFMSSVWHGVKYHLDSVLQNSLWIVGKGDQINLWTDNWLGEPLVTLFHIDTFFHSSFSGKVSEVIANGTWNLPAPLLVHEITSRLSSVTLPQVHLPDTFV